MTNLSRLIPAVFLFLFIFLVASAESGGFIVRGRVLEQGTRRPLEGVTVFLLERETNTVVTDQDGTFALVVDSPGKFSVMAVAIGYKRPVPLKITAGPEAAKKRTRIFLEPLFSMTEVVIEADRNPDKTGKIAVSGRDLVSVAGSGGDPLRGMLALPGITTSSDTNNAPAIRGSGPGNNAFYLDFLPVSYLFHFGGGMSVVNAALVHDLNIYTSSFGPEFADVTGGVVDINLRNPRTDRIGGLLHLGTNLTAAEGDWLLEGPISDNKSFSVAVRRSWLDIANSENNVSTSNVAIRQFPEYYDYQGKFVWNLSADHSLTLQTSGADDQVKLTFSSDGDFVKHDPIFAGDFNYKQSYDSLGAVMTSRFSPRMNNKLGISYSKNSEDQAFTQMGHIILKQDNLIVRDHMNIAANEAHNLLLGLDYEVAKIRYNLDVPKVINSIFEHDALYTDAPRFASADTINANTVSLYLKDRWKAADPLTLVIGGRSSYNDFARKNLVEPRVSTEYAASKDTLITGGWGKYHQFPEGFQVIEGFGNSHLDYEKADHYSLGAEHRMPDGWSVRAEEYYKKLYNLVIPHDPENYVNAGSGKAFGTELSLRKELTTNWGGWIAVTHSKTKRHNDTTGENFPFNYDQPYNVSIVYNRKVFRTWGLGTAWHYRSGAPYTPVVGSTTDTYTDSNGNIQTRYVPNYGPLWSERLPAYHALNLSIGTTVWVGKQKVSFGASITNTYNRRNILGYDYNETYTRRKPIEQLPRSGGIGISVAF